MLDMYSSQAGRTYAVGDATTISPALRPLLERVRQREAANLQVRRRISRKMSPGDDAASILRNSLLRISPSSATVAVEDG